MKMVGSSDFDWTDYFNGNGGAWTAARIALTTPAASTKQKDSQRYGYSWTYPARDSDTVTDPTFDDSFSGHVFGELGANFSDADVGHRWVSTDANNSDYLNYLQVAVLPDNSDFEITDTKNVEITASAIALNDFTAPSPTPVGKATYEDITGASALIASTMALGTLAYTLF